MKAVQCNAAQSQESRGGTLIGWVTRSRRRGRQGGFTLIELLVVVVILGVLSAVVVFAVKGSGNKGYDAAAATDERVIRTALETFCAQRSHYPRLGDDGWPDAMNVLVTQKFLSGRSEYNDLTAGGTQGSCAGEHYTLIRNPNATGAGGTTTTTWAGNPARCGDPQGWCPISHPNTAEIYTVNLPGPMVRLPSGKVLAVEAPSTNHVPHSTNFELFDPSVSPNGAWLPVPPYPGFTPLDGVDSMTLIDGNCLERCGSVLFHIFGLHGTTWQLYDALTGAWSLTPPVPSGLASSDFELDVAQIKGSSDQCASNCGKLLVAFKKGVELYDPQSNSFTFLGRVDDGGAKVPGGKPQLAALGDGRVLLSSYNLFEGAGFDVERRTKLFNPKRTAFDDATPSALVHLSWQNPAVVLRDGLGVLHLGRRVDGSWGAEVFKPDGGGGSWEPAQFCRPAGDRSNCFILATLENGKVMAKGVDDYFRTGASKDIYLFDPVTLTWSQTGSTNSPETPQSGVLLSGGACAPNCGKVLAAGGNEVGSAELYTPPTS